MVYSHTPVATYSNRLFFSALTECLSLTPRKYCEIESKWFPCDSLPQMAADIACVNHREWKQCEAFIWTVRLDGRAFANVNLWKRKSRMYSDCHLYLPAKWATRDGRPADLERFFVKGVGILSAFYGDMDLCSAIDGESSPGRGPWHLKYEFPTFRWRTFFGNAVVSFFGERKFDGLPCRTERLASGMLLDFGAIPEEADLNRNRKLEAERILGEYSFVVPAAFPQVDVDSDRFRRSMFRPTRSTDSLRGKNSNECSRSSTGRSRREPSGKKKSVPTISRAGRRPNARRTENAGSSTSGTDTGGDSSNRTLPSTARSFPFRRKEKKSRRPRRPRLRRRRRFPTPNRRHLLRPRPSQRAPDGPDSGSIWRFPRNRPPAAGSGATRSARPGALSRSG